MASRSITVPKDVWTNLSNGATGGSIRLIGSLRPLQLTQQTTAPTGTVAVSAELNKVEQYATFYGLPAGENVWALSRDSAAQVVVSDAD